MITFNLHTAQEFAQANRLETWIHAYLNSGDNPNPGLSEGLKQTPRWWIGPIELPLEALTRCCGPEPHMEYVMPPDGWARRTGKIAQTLRKLADLPPLIVAYRDGELSIRDGNHRYGALEQRGLTTCWVIIWFNTQADYEAFQQAHDM